MKKNNKTKKGFSIGEVMVAMFILIFGIVSAVFLTAQSVKQIGESRNAAIATLLAQEGTELVKNVRDNNVTQMNCGTSSDERCTAFDDDTGYGLGSDTNSEYKCIIEYGNAALTKILDCNIVEGQGQLYINEQTYLYSHSGGGSVVTPFKRRIYIKYTNTNTGDLNDVVAEVASVVIWRKGEFPSSIDNIKTECKIGKDCVFTKTNLTSWINYGE